MALVAGYTFWSNASDADHCFRATNQTTQVADGENARSWQDEGDVTNFAWIVNTQSDSQAPIWRASGINSLGSLEFDGVNDRLTLYDDGWNNPEPYTTPFTAPAGTAWVVFKSTAITGTGKAFSTADHVFGYVGGYMGIFVWNDGGVYKAFAGMYDGVDNRFTSDIVISLGTTYIALMKWNGTTLSLTLNDGTPATVAAADLGGGSTCNLGEGGPGSSVPFTGQIGEVVTYNTHQSGTDEDDNWAYFLGKWTAAGGVALPVLMTQYRQRRT